MKLKLHTAFPVITLCLTLPAMAADITWDSGGSDDNWSTFDNWSDNATPAGDDVTFNNTGGAAGTTVTNIVDTSFSIDSLNFRQDNTVNQTMSISSGQTLTVAGSFLPTSGENTAVLFGQPNLSATATTTHITGLGTFTVNSATNHFLVGYATSGSGITATVNMSGLSNFNATVDIFGVGRKGTTSTNTSRQQAGVITLTKNNTITANEISVGSTTHINGTTGTHNNSGTSTLNLGSGGSAVNNLNADRMSFGIGKATGNMNFAGGVVSTDTVTIRNKAGTGAVGTFEIGIRNMSSSSGTPSGTVNFGVGSVDALINNLNVGQWANGAGTSGVNPTGTFTTGTNALSTITVTTLNLANSGSTTNPGSARVVTGNLNVTGGVFSASTVNLATGSATANLTKTANLNVDGGTFRFGTFGAPTGTNAVTINFNSGTVSSIDGTGRTLGLAYNLGKAGGGTTVAFGQASGGTGTIALNGAGTLLGNTTVETVQNTTLGGALGGAFSLTKSGAGTLTLSGNNAYNGATDVNIGVLRITHANALGATGATARTNIAGNDNTSRVELSGGISTGETFQIGMRQNAAQNAPALSNLSGNNTVTGDINGVTGGARINIESQAGLLTLAGNLSQTSGTGSRTWQLMGAGDGLVSGVISNGTADNLGISKSGNGTWTLSNTNTYTGTTSVAAGTLAIGTGGSIANSTQIIVGANTTLDVSAVAFTLGATVAQTLSGTGTINGSMTIGTNGTLAIGTSPGTMTFNNNLGLNADSISNFEINSFTLGNYDLALAAVDGTQTVDFGGGTLNLLFQSGFSTEGTVKIFDFDTYTGSGFTSVVSTGLASGFTASFDASTGIVTVIPEPSAALLGGLGVLALLRRRRA